ncbi:hypothetical protein PLICBS_010366 [Purpureocillium lilacinum]|uniref:uncharacterized protein n=1 Tax=Purpureocillium lilacinum TaxID=33203 RepID=UPI0020826D21|nr:hypothetical protein PLICBS_010366 [Purpureocillium lilacinum]
MSLWIMTCCCCGAEIKDPDEAPHAPWMTLYRAVYAENGLTAPACLSGVSLRVDEREDPDADRVVLDRDESILDDPMPSTEIIRLMRTSFNDPLVPSADGPQEGRWGFPFHASCWDIMVDIAGMGKEDEDLQALFEVLRSFPCPQAVMSWGHSYFGLYRVTEDTEFLSPEDGRRLAYATYTSVDQDAQTPVEDYDAAEDGHFAGDVLEFADLVAPSPATSPKPFRTDDVSGGGTLSLLPDEIFTDILLRLPSRDVRNVRIASRRAALMRLPDAFFHSRFVIGYELAHIWEAYDVKEHYRGTWHTIYTNFKYLSDHPALINRKRVWRLARMVVGLVNQTVGLSCDGELASRPKTQSYVSELNNGALGMACSSKWLEDQKRPFLVRTSGFLFRRIYLPGKIRSVSACTVNVFGQNYLSGLRFEGEEGETKQIGYVRESALQTLEWSEFDDRSDGIVLFGLYLAHDEVGVRGIAAVTTDEELSAWIRDHVGIPKRRLVVGGTPPMCPNWPRILARIDAGFDGLRLLSMALRSKHWPECPGDPGELDHRDSVSWIPDVPPPGLIYSKFTNMSGSSARCFSATEPSFLCFFGGPTAEIPEHKGRITVHINSERRIVGFETVLVNGDHRTMIGKEASTRNSFEVDFPDDERVVNVIYRKHRYGPDEITECGLIGGIGLVYRPLPQE